MISAVLHITAMEARTSPSPPFSTAGLGPCELSYSYYLHDEISDYQQWVFWSKFCNDQLHLRNPPRVAVTAADGAVIKDKIISFLRLLGELRLSRWLVQFWGLVKTGDKMYLTTCDHPFALCYRSYNNYQEDVKRLCEYRKRCLNYLILPVDDDDIFSGPPARVFRSGLPEHAFDVSHYTSREHPQRDYTVGRFKDYWALPVYHHPTQHLPSGVLEFVSPSYCDSFGRHLVLQKLQKANLTTTRLSLAEVSPCQASEIAKIYEALDMARRRHKLLRARTWTTSGETLSLHGGFDFIRKGQGVVGKAFSSKSACFCRDIRQLSITEYPLVPDARGRGDSACFAVCLQSSCSNNCIYILEFCLPCDAKDCGDPRTLLHMIMETLEEHLQSSFKFALGQELGQKLTVEIIKVSPEDEFDSFEICNTTDIESTPRIGEVQGEEGMMQIYVSSRQIDAAKGSMDGIHKQQDGSVGSTPRLAKAQGGKGMTQVDTANAYINDVHGKQSGIVEFPPRQGFVNISYQESMAVQFNASNLARVHAANNSMNCIYEQQNGIVGSSPGQELVQNIENIAHDEPNTGIDVVNLDRDGVSMEQSGNEAINVKKQKSGYTLKSDLGITREVLEQNSSRNLEDATKVLGVSRSTLKRICREYGINRWPPRKARKVNQAPAEQKVVQPSTDNIEEQHRPDTTRLEDDSSIWVKAEYQGRTMKFRLPLSACKFNLEEKVAQRLNLSVGHFEIDYQDEDNEWIWIACDEDLNTCMSTLSSLGRTTIKMLVR